jgi:superfamily II DNA/RNA helicase
MKLIECSTWVSVCTIIWSEIFISTKYFTPILIFISLILEPQVRSICNHVRPDRQTLLFSATFKKRIEKLARDVLTDPIRIVQGDVGEANTDVTQHVIVFYNNPTGKWTWLNQNIVEFLSSGSLLIFVTKKVRKIC